MQLADTPLNARSIIARLDGSRAFRRRLMELGLVPGTRVEVVGKAPLGGPFELLARGCSLSIRREDANAIEVTDVQVGHRSALPLVP
ncbi:MAG: ferrous iron transport protein A [Polyangiaceae bacterium]|nr:ferrous iron transport protein A [Polyangiaceae bacterium]